MSSDMDAWTMPTALSDGNRTKAVSVNLTPGEHQLIKKAAAKIGMPVGRFILIAALADAGWTVHAHPQRGLRQRRNDSVKKNGVGIPFLSTRCRNALLIHVQGHACHNDAGFSDEALLRATLGKTCLELRWMRGVGKGKLVEIRRHLSEHGLALKCGCPQRPCLEYMKRETGHACESTSLT